MKNKANGRSVYLCSRLNTKAAWQALFNLSAFFTYQCLLYFPRPQNGHFMPGWLPQLQAQNACFWGY